MYIWNVEPFLPCNQNIIKPTVLQLETLKVVILTVFKHAQEPSGSPHDNFVVYIL